jgi:hypothetical protein
VADVAYEHLMDPERKVSITLSKRKLGNEGRYGSVVLNNTYPKIIKLLAAPELGLVEMSFGCKFDWEGEGVKQSTIRADHELVKLVAEYQLSILDFRVVNASEVIILKKAKEYESDEKEIIPYKDTVETNRYRGEVQRVNRWLSQADIIFDEAVSARADPLDRHLRRIFNNSSFQQGGRLYGGFWQLLSKRQRKEGIFINECSVTTLDYGQIAPRILYGMAKAQPAFEDAYHVPSIDPRYRQGIKKLLNALIHSDKRPTSFPKGIRELIPDRSIRVDHVIDAILEVHASVAHLFYAGQGMQVMFNESQILIDVLGRLIDEGIVALPIHDALVVADDDASHVRGVMIETFKEHTGVDITVTNDDG